MASALDKGKGRAIDTSDELQDNPTESTPLLRPPQPPPPPVASLAETTEPDSHSRRFRLLPFFCLFLAISSVTLLILALAAFSRLRRDVDVEQSLQFRIDDLRLLNISESEPLSVWINVKATWWLKSDHLHPWEKTLLSLGVRVAKSVTVSPSRITVYPTPKDPLLLTISIPELTVPLPHSIQDSREASITFQAVPSPNTPYLIHIAEQSWNISRLDTIAVTDDISFQIGSFWGRHTLSSITRRFIYDVPKFPFLPPPPSPLLHSLAATLHISEMRVNPNRTASAIATLPNPLPYFLLPKFTTIISPNISGTIYLPPPGEDGLVYDLLPILKGSPSEIFISTRAMNLTIPVHGTLQQIPSTPTAEKQLSNFLSTFLAGQDSPIVISAFNKFIPFNFPGPNPKPKVLRDVHLSDVRISLRGSTAVISGTLQVVIALPKGVNLTLEVKRATVDLFAFDGPVIPPPPEDGDEGILFPHIPLPFPLPSLPAGSHRSPRIPLPGPVFRHDEEGGVPSPPPHPIPDPLPPHAFARIRPEYWLNATSVLVDPNDPSNPPNPGSEDESQRVHYLVTANFKHLPLEILPGRDAVFRGFVAKFLLHREALAGVQGFAGVGVTSPGLLANPKDGKHAHERGVLELLELPFDGEVLVGKGNF